MKSKVLRIISVLLIISAVSLFLYPDISKQIMKEKNDEIINRFESISEEIQNKAPEKAVVDDKDIDEKYLIDEGEEIIIDYPNVISPDIDRLRTDSLLYNKQLREHQNLDCDFSQAALDLNDYGIDDGVYGYISASAVGLNIPIYLGADENNLAHGAAHLMNTSLPLGGEDTNAVFAGHTGYFGRTIFDDIPILNTGDTVSVTTYFGTLDYHVISVGEIGATSTNDIYIVKGKDLLTLITCADMGKTRYEVICERN